MQNLELYLADLKSTGKNTIETVEKSLTDMFIRLVKIYPCLIGLYAPPNKQNILYNICRPTMLHKYQSCTNVIQMFCVHSAVMKHLFYTFFLKARFISNSTRRVAYCVEIYFL